MKLGTANGRLRKSLLFHLAKKCDMHYCYQCGGEIENLDEFSIEHKTPWLDSENPQELYFDVENIAFSHYVCNVGAARRPNQKYKTQREAMDARSKARRDRRKNETPEERETRLRKRRERRAKKKLESMQ